MIATLHGRIGFYQDGSGQIFIKKWNRSFGTASNLAGFPSNLYNLEDLSVQFIRMFFPAFHSYYKIPGGQRIKVYLN